MELSLEIDFNHFHKCYQLSLASEDHPENQADRDRRKTNPVPTGMGMDPVTPSQRDTWFSSKPLMMRMELNCKDSPELLSPHTNNQK